jgi:hypothetical protein
LALLDDCIHFPAEEKEGEEAAFVDAENEHETDIAMGEERNKLLEARKRRWKNNKRVK